ncbi:MAG: hypothetical protein U0401_24730 [Anaerolineae bacterium]
MPGSISPAVYSGERHSLRLAPGYRQRLPEYGGRLSYALNPTPQQIEQTRLRLVAFDVPTKIRTLAERS